MFLYPGDAPVTCRQQSKKASLSVISRLEGWFYSNSLSIRVTVTNMGICETTNCGTPGFSSPKLWSHTISTSSFYLKNHLFPISTQDRTSDITERNVYGQGFLVLILPLLLMTGLLPCPCDSPMSLFFCFWFGIQDLSASFNKTLHLHSKPCSWMKQIGCRRVNSYFTCE